MGLKLVEIKDDTVILESDLSDFGLAIAELCGSGAKDFALAEATKVGMSRPGHSGVGYRPYPVDSDGKIVALEGKAHNVNRYRVDIPVTAGLV